MDTHMDDEIARIVEIDEALTAVEDRVRELRLSNLDRLRALVHRDVPVVSLSDRLASADVG